MDMEFTCEFSMFQFHVSQSECDSSRPILSTDRTTLPPSNVRTTLHCLGICKQDTQTGWSRFLNPFPLGGRTIKKELDSEVEPLNSETNGRRPNTARQRLTT